MSTTLWVKISTNMKPTVIKQDAEPSLEEKQEAVGGLIEYCTYKKGHHLPFPTTDGIVFAEILETIAHEEGRMRNEAENIFGTYCAYGVPAESAPIPIVGDVLVKLRIPDKPKFGKQSDVMRLVLGLDVTTTHMMPAMGLLQEADYDMEGI